MTLFSRYVRSLEKEWASEKRNFKDQGWTRGLPYFIEQDEFHEAVGHFINNIYDLVLRGNGETHYLEKATDTMPVANSIIKHVPNAKFVNVIRDGRNVTISRYSMWQRFGRPFGVQSVEEGAHSWKDGIRQARDFAGAHSHAYIEVHYEELLERRQMELKRIFEFCGLPAPHSLLSEIEREYDFSKVQIGTPTPDIRRDGANMHQGWREKMPAADRYRFHVVAGDLLQELGYAPAGWWYDSVVSRIMAPGVSLVARGSDMLLDLSLRKVGRKFIRDSRRERSG